MGICESSKEKEKLKIITKKDEPNLKINNNNQNILNNEDDNLNKLQTHPSTNSQEKVITPPGLVKYDTDGKISEFSTDAKSKVASIFSSQQEEEVIIRNEINTKIVNKEGDFNNMDLRNLVKNNGGIIIKDNDKLSNILSYQGINPSFDLEKPNNRPEIKSMKNIPVRTSKILPKDLLRLSSKINVSFHENTQKNDALINIPKTDEPLPDLDELSTASPLLILRNSQISQND